MNVFAIVGGLYVAVLLWAFCCCSTSVFLQFCSVRSLVHGHWYRPSFAGTRDVFYAGPVGMRSIFCSNSSSWAVPAHGRVLVYNFIHCSILLECSFLSFW